MTDQAWWQDDDDRVKEIDDKAKVPIEDELWWWPTMYTVQSTVSWMWKGWRESQDKEILFHRYLKYQLLRQLLMTDLKRFEMLTSSIQIEPRDEFEWNCKLRWNVEGEISIYLTPPCLKFHHGSSKEPFQWTFSKFLSIATPIYPDPFHPCGINDRNPHLISEPMFGDWRTT